MTAHRYVTLTCDLCGAASQSARSIVEARAIARAKQWRFSDYRDLCPKHPVVAPAQT